MNGIRNADGFTFVEVLVALVILALGVLAAAPMFMLAMRGNSLSGELSSVNAAAQNQLEILRATDFDTLIAGGDLNDNSSEAGVDFFDASDPDLLIRWEVKDNTNPVNTKTITVRAISNQANVGVPPEVTITTLRGE